MAPLDYLTFTRAGGQMNAARQRGTNPRLLDSAYGAGGMLADKDIAIGRVCSATEVIERVMTQAAREIDTVAAALAGYYARLAAEAASGLSALLLLPLPSLLLTTVTPAHLAATNPTTTTTTTTTSPSLPPGLDIYPPTHHLPAPRLSSPPAAGTSDRERELDSSTFSPSSECLPLV